MVELSQAEHIHIIGAGGAGMSALAKVLAQMSHIVTGSDLKFSPFLHELRDLGMDVWEGSDPARLEGADLVVASSAVGDGDPEVRAAKEAGIDVWRRPNLLSALTKIMTTIGATGTHGKTSTTAMLVRAFRSSGRDPSFVVGGQLSDLRTNGSLADRDLLVLEVDEAFGTFLGLSLSGLVVTNMEEDHLDYYGSFRNLEDAFADVVERVDGPVVVGIDDEGGRRLARRTGRPSYGTVADADWHIDELSGDGVHIAFRLTPPNGGPFFVEVPKPGIHVARNAAGALALMGELGYDLNRAVAGLAAFAGVHRRFEIRGTVAGVTIVDDYAHHPTEVTATLEAARRGTWRRIWAIFQPHRYSRTAELHREFGPAFAEASDVVVTDVYPAGEGPVPGITGALVADAVEETTNARVTYIPHRADIAAFLAREVRSGDLVLSLGAGDISLLPDELAILVAETVAT